MKLESIKITATKTLAFVKNPDREHIISSTSDKGVADTVAEAVKNI